MSYNNNYRDNNFTLYQAYSYTLLLQVEATTFNYAVVDDDRLLVTAQNCDLQELVKPGDLNDLLHANYKKVIVGMPSSAFSLIPESLFSADKVAGFAGLLDVREDEKVFAQTLDEQNAIVYKTPATLVSVAEGFGVQHTVYTAKGWLKAITLSRPSNNSLYLEIGNDRAQFAYFSLNGLQFYNSFEFRSADDLAYFNLFVTTGLNLVAESITLVISGNIIKGDESFRRLADFYPNIILNDIKVLELPEQIQPHTILALAALTLCGSSEDV